MTARPFGMPPQRLATRLSQRRARVSLTPLIDVVFILLVFFMLASSLLQWRSIDLDASAKTAAAPPRNEDTSIVVDVRTDGIRIADETIALDTLTRRLEAKVAETPDRRVLVRPADGVLLQDAIVVLDRLKAAGVRNMSLIRAP